MPRSADARPPRLFGAGFDADPHPAYDWLREHSPVHRLEFAGGVRVWLVTRYEDARDVLADPNMAKDPAAARGPWRSAGLGLPFDHRLSLARHMVNADPPDHTRLRAAVRGAFTPRRVRLLRERAQQITDGLLDRVAGTGRADLIADLAYPLPIALICDILGVPESDRADFHAQAAVIDSSSGEDLSALAAATDWMDSYIRDLVDERLAHSTDDLLGGLADRHRGGEISHEELTSTAFLLLVAGHETTVALIGNTLVTLLRHPARLAALREDPGRTPAVIEEVLRLESPVQNATWRFPLRPARIGGVELEPGDPVLVSLLAANRDPRRFERPGVFDPGRTGPHLGFGHGPHFCIGAALARMEGRVAIDTALRRLPELRLDAAEHELRWWPSPIMHGLFALPAAFTAAPG